MTATWLLGAENGEAALVGSRGTDSGSSAYNCTHLW